MKNADRVAKIIVDTVGPPPEMDRILAAQFYVAIKDALEDAYQEGAEDMKNKLQPWNYLKRTPEGGGR